MGEFGDSESVGFKSCTSDEFYMIGSMRLYYYPCGSVARRIFNDTFMLQGPAGEINFSRPTALYTNFVSKNDEWLRSNCYKIGDDGSFHISQFNGSRNLSTSYSYDCWTNVSDPDLSTWMEISEIGRAHV